MKRLKTILENLFKVVEEDFPDQYQNLISLGFEKKARLTDGKESVILAIRSEKIRVMEERSEGLSLPVGRFSREAIVNLIDGYSTLNEAVKLGLIDCTGEETDILLFFRMLRIVLNVSARSVRAYKVWQEF